MDTLKRSIDAAAGSVQAGAQQMEFLRATSQRLGLDLVAATKGYSGLLAATTAAGKSTAVAQEIFQNFAAASTVAGHSAETFSGIMLAVTQIMSKGTFSAEELRGQLAERLPQAVGALGHESRHHHGGTQQTDGGQHAHYERCPHSHVATTRQDGGRD